MQPTSDFELAQKRLKDRQRRQSSMILWSIVCVGMILANAAFGLGGCWTILTICTGLMAVTKLIQLYYDSLNRPLADDLIAREMEWLFDTDWRQTTGAAEYTFAQDRIRKQRLDRWLYGFSFLLVIPVSALCISALLTFTRSAQSGALCFPVFGVLLVSILATRQGRRVFASERELAKSERKVGNALRLELQRMHPPEKLKNEDKPKRNVEYTVGDDGELVELDSIDEDKPKRDRL